MLKKLIMVAVLLGAGSASLVASQRKIDAIRSDAGDELLYLPNEKLLTHFTAGLSSVVADLLWLKTIEYTVGEFHNDDRNFAWLESMCRTVTRLDPRFEGAYRYGGMLMAAIGADDKALDFLNEGCINNPFSEQIPFEIVQVYLLNRWKDPDTSMMATKYLRIVAERSDHPEFYFNWIQRIQQHEDFGTMAIDLWQEVLETSDDEFIREVAKDKLEQQKILQNVRTLDQAIKQYEKDFGKNPASFDEMTAAGFLADLPQEAGNGTYFIDANGAAQNTVIVDAETDRLLNALNSETQRYKKANGAFPLTLEEWAKWNGLDEVPAHPYSDGEWLYDPATGKVTSSR